MAQSQNSLHLLALTNTENPRRLSPSKTLRVKNAWRLFNLCLFSDLLFKGQKHPLDSRSDSFFLVSSIQKTQNKQKHKTNLFPKMYRTLMLSNTLSKKKKGKSSDFESVQVQSDSLLICQWSRGEQYFGGNSAAINL